MQAVPPQQIWPASPQGVGIVPPALMRQVPELHSRPGLQAVPQHIWPSPPQAAGAALQRPMSQVRPGLHELPAQHAWSRSPQAVGVVHMSPTHASEPVHVEPGQHA